MAFPAYPDLLSERPSLAKITVLREGTGQGAQTRGLGAAVVSIVGWTLEEWEQVPGGGLAHV